MRYYDATSGRVVDTSTVMNPSGGSSGGTYNTGGLPTGESDLQKILGSYALSKGDVSSAWSILKPQTPKKTFTDAALEKINNTRDTLDRVDRIVGVLQRKGNKFPQGFLGKLAEAYVQTGAAGTFGGLDPEVQQTIGDIILLRGQGDRQLIGGRLTGYLLDRLGVGFPGVEKSSSTNLRHLNQLKKTLINDLDSYATNAGLGGYQDLLSNSQASTGDFNQDTTQADPYGIR